MKKLITFLTLFIAIVAMTACSEYSYETVKGDSTKTRIYTLDNGLKVYMSVNKQTPRLHTLIAVKVGAKNDPAETTGLAHYFEHLMFKGTEKFGTQDYAAEKPLLDEIERLFELYRSTTDAKERKAIYAQIDSVSQLAAQYAIPNEYDKLMTAIGADGTNAWTSYDETTYTEDIPSNQIENWAKIQADRFENAVIRGFHTELETVYEEYNMSLTQDIRKLFEKFQAIITPDHPYGQHSVLGTQEHLKNPSITNIKNYHDTYYVPNNMAICMAGDFDPDEAIKIVDRYFGKLKPNESLPEWQAYKVTPLTEPKVAEVVGLENEALLAGWATGSAASDDALMIQIAGSVLSNQKCGLIDVDINQKQRVLASAAYIDQNADCGSLMLYGMPKGGQTLEEVLDLLLAEVEKLRNGEFDEEMLKSIIANLRRNEMEQLESNYSRALSMHSAFINGQDWKDVVSELDRLAKITKADVVEWANKNLPANGYAVVYKRKGVDASQKAIEKPQITPIPTNRDAVSDFLCEVQNTEVRPIAPVFVDFKKDMSVTNMNGNIEVLYKKNEVNELFDVEYMFDFGLGSDPIIGIARDYFELLGTDTKSLEQIQNELYALACDFNIRVGYNNMAIGISGLADNMDKAIALVEDYIANVQGDDAVLAEVKNDCLQDRANRKTNQRAIYGALVSYCKYGKEALHTRTLTNEQVMALSSDELVDRIKSLPQYKHRVLYYGPLSKGAVVRKLNQLHRVAETPLEVEDKHQSPTTVESPEVYFVQYDAKQIYYQQYSCRDNEKFDLSLDPAGSLYDSYFSSSMNAIVFQEMREARGLAYSAYTRIDDGVYADDSYSYSAFIATQNDKMQQAIEAFAEIINDMPRSEAAFALAKQGLLTNIATQRTTGSDVLWLYVTNGYKGVTVDRNKAIYEAVQSMTLDDVVAFQQKYIKDRTYRYCILGDKNNLDMKYLSTLGPIRYLTLEDIFGF